MSSSKETNGYTIEQLVKTCGYSFDEAGDPMDSLPHSLFVAHQWIMESTTLLDAFSLYFHKTTDLIVRRSVLFAVAYWIHTFPFHFDDQPDLECRVNSLRAAAAAAGEDDDIVNTLDCSQLPSYAWMRALSVRHPVSKQVSLSFDQWSPEDLSNSLTHIDFKILSRITIAELKKYVREGKLREAPVLERSITIFNNLSNWVQCMVLSKPTPNERAEIVTKFVKVGKCLKKQHNYNTLMAVIGGVTHSNIARLGKTHAILASDIKKDLSSLSTLLSMQSNYAQYRKALEDCKKKLHIPIMGVHLKDLIAASVGLDFEKSGRISKKKLHQLASTFSHFMLFTHASSTRNQLPEPNADLINTLKVSLDIRYNDDDMYQLSLRREPRTLLTFEPSSKSIVFADWASGVSAVPDRETVEKHIAAMVDAVFKHYDHDKDNYISQSEFRQIAGNFPFIDPFGTIDVDRDGQISRVEMNEYFMRMNKCSDLRAEFKHNFQESSFIAPTTCGNCTKVLWGFFRHGHRCVDCGLAVHDSCRDNVVAECRRKSSDKGSVDSKSENGKDSSRGISDWFSARNSYNASFRKIFGSVRSSRYRTSSTLSQSPEHLPRSPHEGSKSARLSRPRIH
ncbi:hypothetical protein PMAYCL1PPCAC_29869 [Pristionchus mayeri]|uniref:Rgef-1 n=1 Tax=Pristionchus mayeri TaxID=1317129 RepID=A0AAN5DAW7_9BILA|nr:hypothetical protein PMAYCL1PPCAC_29869 [Pristionchus mayeri]